MKNTGFGFAMLLCVSAPHAVAQPMTSGAAPEAVSPPATAEAPAPATQSAPGSAQLSVGSFVLYPELRFAVTRDDNIYAARRGAARRDEARDTVFTVSPSLEIESDWQRHALNFSAGVDIDRYRDYRDENVDDYWLGFDGRFDLTEHTNIFGGARHSRDHEDRFTPGALSPSVQREPTRFHRDEAHLGIASEIGQWRLRAGGTYDRFDFRDGRSVTGGSIDNEYRDHTMRSLGLRLGYALASGHEIFAQYATDRRSYDRSVPGTNFDRSSDGYRAALGVNIRAPKQRLSAEVFAGVLRQDFDHRAFSSVSSPYFGGFVVWRPAPAVAVTGFVDRTLAETTVYQDGRYASSSLDTTWGVGVERGLGDRMVVSARAARTRSDYQDFDREDRVLDASVGLRYYFSPSVYLDSELRWLDRWSNDIEARYTRSQIMFSIGYAPGAKKNPVLGQSRLMVADGLLAQPPGGFYAGAALGVDALHTTTSGARGGEGSDRAGMGDSGLGGAVFAGYDFVHGRWHFGPEIELANSRADWSHSKGKDTSRTSSVDKGRGYGVGLRLGYLVDNGVLMYTRLGAVRTRFNTYYTQNDFRSGAYDRSETQSGKRVGVGMDIPTGANTFARLEYVYGDYGRNSVPYRNPDLSQERFDTREALFRLGLGWKFGGTGSAAAPARPAVSGFYAGAHVGHGALESRLSGRHTDQDAAPFSLPFAGDFGDLASVLGLYAGYGRSFGRWYGGLELEADASHLGWRHEREVSGAGGRDFSVDMKGGYGAAVRLGYTLRNGSLLYARVGAVRTRFETTWAKGNNADANIDRSDRVDGVRFGIGAEVPLTDDTFVRLDYTRTRYDTVRFTTAHGNPDQMEFASRANLFRIGLGVRF